LPFEQPAGPTAYFYRAVELAALPAPGTYIMFRDEIGNPEDGLTDTKMYQVTAKDVILHAGNPTVEIYCAEFGDAEEQLEYRFWIIDKRQRPPSLALVLDPGEEETPGTIAHYKLSADDWNAAQEMWNIPQVTVFLTAAGWRTEE
jgi:hypothetical protein